MLLPLLTLTSFMPPFLINYSSMLTTVTNVGLIVSLVPVFNFVNSVCLGREKPSIVSIGALMVALIGVMGMLDLGGLRISVRDAAGIGVTLLNDLFGAAYADVSKFYREWDYPGAFIAFLAFLLAAIVSWVALLVSLPFSLPYATPITEIPLGAWISLLYAGVVGTGVVWFIVSWSSGYLPTLVIGTQMLLVPPCSAVFGFLFFDEKLSFTVIMDTALIVIALVLLIFRPSAPRRPSTSNAEVWTGEDDTKDEDIDVDLESGLASIVATPDVTATPSVVECVGVGGVLTDSDEGEEGWSVHPDDEG